MKVSIITCTSREKFMENVFKNYDQQHWDEKELIIILNKDELDLNKWKKTAEQYPNVRVFKLHEGATLGDCLNFGILKANYDYIAKFDDDDYYGPDYLTNSMKGFKNDEVFILGKSSYYVYFTNKKALMLIQNKENTFDESVAGASLIFKKEVYNKVQFQKRTRAEDYFFIEDCKKKGYKIYATTKDDFVVIRHDAEQHTWKIDDEDFLTWGKIIAYTDDFHSYITKNKASTANLERKNTNATENKVSKAIIKNKNSKVTENKASKAIIENANSKVVKNKASKAIIENANSKVAENKASNVIERTKSKKQKTVDPITLRNIYKTILMDFLKKYQNEEYTDFIAKKYLRKNGGR